MRERANDRGPGHDPSPGRGAETAARMCDAAGCTLAGEYRAPKARDRLREYYWFCLEHVRAYNAAWNYYADMDEVSIERERRADTYWHRPTWRFGGRDHRGPFADPFGVFADELAEAAARRARLSASAPELAALEVLGLAPPASRDEIKRRYKELVKRHHPDTNGGDRAAEERLKAINDAYATLTRAAEA